MTESSVAATEAVLSIVEVEVALLFPQAIKKILKAMKLKLKLKFIFFFMLYDLYKVRISMKMELKITK